MLVIFIILELAIMGALVEARASESVFTVHPETAKLEVLRVDFRHRGEPVIVRRFARDEKSRGLFGSGWCSNLDMVLIGADATKPKVLELRECGKPRVRNFHKILDAWVEDSSPSRILRKPDGRWELTESPYPTFRHDGLLDSFQVDQDRWYVRRDSNGRPEGLDNLKSRPVKFRRTYAGDLDAIVDGKNLPLIRYEIGVSLAATEAKGLRESFEYDADGNILRLLRVSGKSKSDLSEAPVDVWRFSYTNPDWLASVHEPSGCKVSWILERQNETQVSRETRNCAGLGAGLAPNPVKATSVRSKAESAMLPVARKVAGAPVPIKPNGGNSVQANELEILKPGPMGIGKERARVTLNPEGFPVAFHIEGSSRRRLEVSREAGSGSVVSLRSGDVEVHFRKKPREYTTKQLELLDEYEEWMAAWASR